MNWVALAELLYKIFGPIIEAWLRDLLKREGPGLGDFPMSTGIAISQWFDAARARTGWLDFRTRTRLRILEAIANRHTPAIATSMRHGAVAPQMSQDDAAALAKAM